MKFVLFINLQTYIYIPQFSFTIECLTPNVNLVSPELGPEPLQPTAPGSTLSSRITQELIL